MESKSPAFRTDILSEDIVERHRLTINRGNGQQVKLPNGNVLHSLGTVSAPFSFQGEKEIYTCTFHVLKRCLHDIIFGNSFLKATKTLTNFRHRITEKLVRYSKLPFRVRLLDCLREGPLGLIDGNLITASPDTGSDVMIISKRLAKRLGLHINTNKEYRTDLELADGSFLRTAGMVLDVNWRFHSDPHPTSSISCDFHVLDNLHYEVFLSNEFLYDNQVFSKYQDDFIDLEEFGFPQCPFADLALIRERRKHRSLMQVLGDLFASNSGNGM
jgi:hypothetical protein